MQDSHSQACPILTRTHIQQHRKFYNYCNQYRRLKTCIRTEHAYIMKLKIIDSTNAAAKA